MVDIQIGIEPRVVGKSRTIDRKYSPKQVCGTVAQRNAHVVDERTLRGGLEHHGIGERVTAVT
jgi:hypothetical protein